MEFERFPHHPQPGAFAPGMHPGPDYRYSQSIASHQGLGSQSQLYGSQCSVHPRMRGKRPSSHRPTVASSASSLSSASSTMSEKARPKNTVVNMVKDTVKAVPLPEVLTIVAVFGVSALHHYKNRGSRRVVPCADNKWARYVCNAMFAYSAFEFAKDNGFIMKKKKAENGGEKDGSRGLGAPSRDAPAYEFDVSWAVPLSASKHYYNCVYRSGDGLANADAQALGAAAAVRALRGETLLQAHRAGASMVDSALAEADVLLRHKAAECALGPGDTIQNAGRVAIATAVRLHQERCARHMSRQ
ncbi:hypothetical protein H4R18_005815 [Coemansia javaensis]|uniref:Uncharacterized protein n=1 Tax=Coemansia javaensis TaxID=2761396 RepID=A0A9W8LCR1_9FUNG|nr:hypothetical protein H4R18_005815 [Coemansia javaensis]